MEGTPEDGSDSAIPVFVDPTNQGVHTGSAVLAVLGANAIVGLVCVPLWFCAVRKLGPFRIDRRERARSSFNPSYTKAVGLPDPPHWNEEEEEEGGHLTDIWSFSTFRSRKSLLAWLCDSSPFVDIARVSGRDTALYLAFMKVMTVLAAFVSGIGVLVFIPLHLFAADVSNDPPHSNHTLSRYEDQLFAKTTIQGCSDPAPALLYVHVAGIFLVTAASAFAVRRFIDLSRSVHTASEPLEASLADRTLKVRHIPARGVTQSDIYDYYSRKYPGVVEAVHLAYDVRKRILWEKRLLELDGKAERASEAERTSDMLMRRRQEVVDAVHRFENRPPSLSAGFGFVVFRNPITRNLAAKSRTVKVNNVALRVSRAHLPGDINWTEVGKPRTAWSLLINSLLCVGLVFFTTPTAIFTAFQQATRDVRGLRDFFSDLDEVSESSFASLVFQYLPVLTYLVLSLTLPLIIEWVTKRQPQISYFEMRQLVVKRLFTYLVMGTFVLPSIALSTVRGLLDLFRDGGDGIRGGLTHSFKHLFLANSGAFFVNLLQVYATLGNLYELWRPIELLWYARDRLWEKKAEEDSYGWVDEFEFAWQYPLVLSGFAIGYNFCVFVPLAGVAFFLMVLFKTLVHAHHARCRVFSRRNALDTVQGGRLVKTLVIILYLSLDLGLFFSFCYFAFRVDSGAKFAVHTGLVFFMLLGCLVQTVGYARQHPKHFSLPDERYGDRAGTGLNLHLGGSDSEDEEDSGSGNPSDGEEAGSPEQHRLRRELEGLEFRLQFGEEGEEEEEQEEVGRGHLWGRVQSPSQGFAVTHSLYATPFIGSNPCPAVPEEPPSFDAEDVELLSSFPTSHVDAVSGIL